MKLGSILIAALLGASGAMALPAARGETPYHISVMSLRSASPIHFGDVEAYHGKFYIWGPGPSTYCPPTFQNCPPGMIFKADGPNEKKV